VEWLLKYFYEMNGTLSAVRVKLLMRFIPFLQIFILRSFHSFRVYVCLINSIHQYDVLKGNCESKLAFTEKLPRLLDQNELLQILI